MRVAAAHRGRGPRVPRRIVIGYYVHHHGAGHRTRFERIAAASVAEVVPLSELDLAHPGALRLPSDVPAGEAHDPTASGSLHWAPLDPPTATARVAALVGWLADRSPSGVVVDVSCEVALLCRLAGHRSVVVRQHGDRDDPVHAQAYRGARALLAPWPEVLEDPRTPAWVVDKTVHAGFVEPRRAARPDPDVAVAGPDDVVVLWGRGGGALDVAALGRLAVAAAPGRVVGLGDLAAVRGAAPGSDGPVEAAPGVRLLGRVDDVAAHLAHRPVVVASAGNGAVADVVGAGCALVVVAQERPFREQERHAEALDRAGLAAWAPADADPATWAAALDLARSRAGALGAHATGAGATTAARAIALALGEPAPPEPPQVGRPHGDPGGGVRGPS